MFYMNLKVIGFPSVLLCMCDIPYILYGSDICVFLAIAGYTELIFCTHITENS